MKIIFWICWIAELITVLWWIITDAQQKNMQVNPFSYLCLIYLIAVIAIRLGLHSIKLSNVMVMIPAVPLMLLGLIILVAMISRGKWNWISFRYVLHWVRAGLISSLGNFFNQTIYSKYDLIIFLRLLFLSFITIILWDWWKGEWWFTLNKGLNQMI